MTPDAALGLMLAITILVMVIVLSAAWAWWSARWYQETIAVSDTSNFASGSMVIIGDKHYMQVVRVQSGEIVVRKPRRR